MEDNIQIIENSNNNILSNIDNYLQYIRDNIKQIIIDDGLKYADPMEKKKIYPDFTYTQFLYILSRLYDRVFSVNYELLYDYYNSPYNKQYNMDKVKLCYEVYYRLCVYYGYNCTVDPFCSMTGIDYKSLSEWLSVGRSDILKIMLDNAKSGVISRFENSKVPILQLAAANHKYKLTEAENTRTEAAAVDVLPDLLQIAANQNKPLAGPDL